MARLTRAMIFADLSSPVSSTSSVFSRFRRRPEKNPCDCFTRGLTFSLMAYPMVLIPPPRRVLMISLESTTISPTPALLTSPARKSTPNRRTISSFRRV